MGIVQDKLEAGFVLQLSRHKCCADAFLDGFSSKTSSRWWFSNVYSCGYEALKQSLLTREDDQSLRSESFRRLTCTPTAEFDPEGW